MDPRFVKLDAIATLIAGDRWQRSVAETARVHQTLLSMIARGERGLTDEVYGKLLTAIDAKLAVAEVNVAKARALRAKLK